MEEYKIWLGLVLGSNCPNGTDVVNSGIAPKTFYETRKAWHAYSFFTKKQMERALAIPLEQAVCIKEENQKQDIDVLSYEDERYPKMFRAIQKSPIVLYFQGDVELLNKPYIISVVGTRHPDREGIKICRDICVDFAGFDIAIASGLAQGLDSIAHKSCLDHNGKTIAFLGTPLDQYYPITNKSLQQEIAQKGLLISEYPLGCKTYPSFFLERNRLIAACAMGVCIVQAKEKSGTLATARLAQEFDKVVFCVPGSILNPLHDGTNHLIVYDGAYPLVSAKQALELLGVSGTSTVSQPIKPKLNLSAEEKIVYQCFGKEALSTNQIFQITHMPMAKLKIILSKLELEDIIKSQSAGVYFKKN